MQLLSNLQRIKMNHERNQVKVTVPAVEMSMLRTRTLSRGNRTDSSYFTASEAITQPSTLLPPKLRQLKVERNKMAQERNYIREQQNLIKQYNIANPSLKFRDIVATKRNLKKDFMERRTLEQNIDETVNSYQKKKLFNPKRMKSVIKNMSHAGLVSSGSGIQLHHRNRTSSTAQMNMHRPSNFAKGVGPSPPYGNSRDLHFSNQSSLEDGQIILLIDN